MARPIITTTVGDVGEIIEDKVNGLLISPKSSEEIAKAVKHLLLDKAFAERLGKRAAETILAKNLTLEKSIKLLEDVYTRVALQRIGFLKKCISKGLFLGSVYNNTLRGLCFK